MITITPTYVTIFWNSENITTDMYLVMWERITSIGCSDEDEGYAISSPVASYNVTGLEEDSSYEIVVMADNAVGSITVMTLEAGMTLIMVCIVVMIFSLILPAPSVAPTIKMYYEVNEFSFTVNWDPVPCIDQNGNITDYFVQYTAVGQNRAQTVSVSEDVNGINITVLMPSTNYSVEVAAVNSAGTGVYSNPIYKITLGI